MTIEEINDKCVSFGCICDEIKVRYRERLMGRAGEPESKRDKVLDEIIPKIEFLVDVGDAYDEKIEYINIYGQDIYESCAAALEMFNKRHRGGGLCD